MAEIISPNFRKDIEKRYGPNAGPGESTIHNSQEYNMGTMHNQLVHEQLNSAENWKFIVDKIKAGNARDISDEVKVDKLPCFIIGSGPSLDDSIKYLKEWKGGIICSTSHALTLMYYGIEPSHILALDPFSCYDEIKGVDWSKTHTKLITHPGVHSSLIQNWPNDLLLYLQNIGRADSFYATAQKIMYSHREGNLRTPVFHFYIRTEFMLFACSPPLQLFVADKLGYENIFLAGCDFAYHTDKNRFTDYTVIEPEKIVEVGNAPSIKLPAQWEKHEHPFVPNDNIKISNNGLPSEEIHLYYKKNLLSACRLSLQNVYTTDHGAITEIPYANIKAVIKRQGDYPKQSKKDIIHDIELYLASVNAFVVETEMGIAFVESLDYRKDLLIFMSNYKKQYTCQNCHIKIQANDGKDHLGSNCPQCNIGILDYTNKIDIDYNMTKFEKLYNMTHEVTPSNELKMAEKIFDEELKQKLIDGGIVK